jgi:hypothetical protein
LLNIDEQVENTKNTPNDRLFAQQIIEVLAIDQDNK